MIVCELERGEAAAGQGTVLSRQDLEAMVCAITHDLRAPLRAIDAFSHLLAEQVSPHAAAAGRRYLGRIHDLVGFSQQLIGQMLDITRIGHVQRERCEVNMSQMAELVVQELRAAEPLRVAHVHIEPGLIIHADPVLCRRLLQNVIGNAWKFTRDSNPARIEITTTNSGPNREFVIRDNGCGLSHGQADQLFKPFSRMGMHAGYDGIGLGLASAKHIVAQYGGSISIAGLPGGGAAVAFTLPAAYGH